MHTTRQTQAAILPIAQIVVGPRHRRDMGNLESLAADIASSIDMLQPIVVRPDGCGRYELACGARRLAAAKLNGRTHIPAVVRDLTDAEMARAEFSENIHRKPFALSEAVAAKRDLELKERAAAKERQREGGRSGGKASGNLPEASKGNAADKAAEATGISRRTLEKAEAIVDAAAAEPERFGKLLADMDRTGRANGVFKRLRVIRQAALIRAEPPPLPGRGPYRVISIDAPWRTQVRADDLSCRRAVPFPSMSIEEICAIPIAALAHDDCVIWHWTTNADLLSGDALVALQAWGFTPKSMLTWVKDRMGLGDWLRGQTEQCIMAVRGNPTVTLTNESTVLFAPAGELHSAKPREFYDLVESLCPAPRYADLFSRYQHNERWDCHGDEAPDGVDGGAP